METTRSCEVYDPTISASWVPAAPLQVPRAGLRLVSLGDRYLAAVGGCDDIFGNPGTECQPLSTVELFDPAKGCWSLLAARLTRPRTCAAVAAVSETSFLVAGGESPSVVASVERYALTGNHAHHEGDEDTAEATSTLEAITQQLPDLPGQRAACQGAMLLLPERGARYPMTTRPSFVVVGGERGAYVDQQLYASAYDLNTGAWRKDAPIPPAPPPARAAVALCMGIGRVSS